MSRSELVLLDHLAPLSARARSVATDRALAAGLALAASAAAELPGRRDLAQEWFATLRAPSKQLVRYEDAAHAVAFEQADEVQKLFNETIVPATYRRSRTGGSR